MKSKFIIIIALAALLAAVLTPPAQAADYGVQKTIWSFGATNVTGTATNLDSAVDLTQFTEFQLEVRVDLTNAAAGTLDLRWTTSNDGSQYTTAPALAGVSGWFSVPLTNNGTTATWRTNISVGALGYWKLAWLTNAAGQSITNASLRIYAKPKNTTLR